MKVTMVPKLSLKYEKLESFKESLIESPRDAEKVIRSLYNEDTIELYEEFIVLFMINSKYIGYHQVTSCSTGMVHVNERAITQIALLSGCNQIIISHNHPSGVLSFSEHDIKLTKSLKKCLGLFKIEVLDHLLVTKDDIISFDNE